MRACPVCSDPPLAQAAIHFERSWWNAVKAEAQSQIEAARVAIKDADAHLNLIGRMDAVSTASGTVSGKAGR